MADRSCAGNIRVRAYAAGCYVDPAGMPHAYVRDPGPPAMFTVYDFPQATGTYGLGVNNAGQIIGACSGGPCASNPFGVIGDQFTGWLRQPVGANGKWLLIDRGASAGAVQGETAARGINARGYIVGLWQAADGTVKGYVRAPQPTKNQYQDVVDPSSPTAARTTEAYGINRGGDIVGRIEGPNHRGFLLSGGVFTPIDVPGASQTFGAFAIDDNSPLNIVGTYLDGSGGEHGFLLSQGVYTTIDIDQSGAQATDARGLNNAGQIVGNWVDSTGRQRAYIAHQ